MESSKRLETNSNTSSNKTLNGDGRFDPTSPTDSNTSFKRLQRKPDNIRRKHSPKGKKQSLNTMFAAFYSPKQFVTKEQKTKEILASSFSNDTYRRTITQIPQIVDNRQTINLSQYKINVLKRNSFLEQQRSSEKQNQQKNYQKSLEVLKSKNKILQQQVQNYKTTNNKLLQKIQQLTSQISDTQKKFQNKQVHINQYQIKQQNYQNQIQKLKKQNSQLQQQTQVQQKQLDLLDCKYLQIQIQLRQIKKSKQLLNKQYESYYQKIITLQEVIKSKDEELYRLMKENQRINCNIWSKEQKLHQLENSFSFKRDTTLQHTNKKLRKVNKQLMHRVNSLLSPNTDPQDISFDLSPQKQF